MRLTLKTKTALLVTLLALGLVAGAGWLQRRQLVGEYVGLLRGEQQTLARMVALGLDYKLATMLNEIERSARSIEPAAFSDPEARERFFDTGGLRPLFDGVALIGLDGRVIANDPPRPGTIGIDVSDRDYFRGALATARPSVSAPLLARHNNRPAVMVAVPVYDARQRPLGLIAAGIDLMRANVLGHLSDNDLRHRGTFELITRGAQPVYVLHADPERLLAPASPLPAQAAGPADLDADLMTHQPLQSVPWDLRAVMPAAAAYAPLHSAKAQLELQLGLLALLTGALVWAATHWMMRPLAQLHEAMLALRRSPGAAVTLDLGTDDERGDLAREFDALMRELRDRQAELAAVADVAPLGLFRSDTTGRITYANDAYLAIHGLAREECADGWLGLLRPEARESARAAWQLIAAGDQPVQVVRRIRRRDGIQVLVSMRSAPVRVDGRVAGHVGTLEDITERARDEKARGQLTAILDATTDYVVQTDTEGRLLYMNPAARRRAGLGPDEPVAHRLASEFQPPSVLRHYADTIVPAAMAQGVWLGESLHWDTQRNEVPVSQMLIAHRGKDGRVEQFSTVMRDISAARAAEEALRRNEQTLRSVAEAMPALVAVVDRERRYGFVNSSFERWHGTPREAVVGKTLREVLGEREYGRSLPWIERVMAGERVVFEKDYFDRETERHLEVTYVPLRTAAGEVDGFVGVAQDITARKQEALRLRELARIDTLTGVLNRAGFEAHLERLDTQRSDDRLTALLYIDLDGFKAVNDRHGHPVGDQLLKHFAKRLRQLVRPGDAVARLGGDEFALVLDGLRQAADAERVASEVVRRAQAPFDIDGQRVLIGASVGIAFRRGSDADWQALVQRADGMLYQAKHGGRGRHASTGVTH